ncbi:MAG TPA: efflux RND transporter periplasmic adaptor subunit [Chthoniobacterales bacterium]|nr:efflux RND transporter periplasmic adaptor subunit [Chthoniobacterales bacterium]
MHDVLKPTTLNQKQKGRGRWLWPVLFTIAFVGAVTGLVLIKTAMMIVVIAAVTALVIWFGFISFRRFRSGRTTSGAVFAVLAVLLLLIDLKALQIRAMGAMAAKMAPPPTTVTSAVVKEEDWIPTLSAVGSISAVQGALLSTDLAGTVAKVNFESGGEAKKGDVLVQLVASQEEADLELARNDLARARDLAARKVISKADLDAAESKLKQKEGVAQHKEVRAPFDGQLGIRQVNVGQMIKEGQQVVQLTALDPVYVDFALPQQELAKISAGLEVRVRTDAVPGREFKGKLTAINSMVDTVTRNVSLQGTLENPDHTLRPGIFAKVDLLLPEKRKALVVPGSAISYAPFGDSVFVIETKKDPKTGKETQSIRQQFVKIGEARGDLVAIADGLKANETIVGTGVFKLRNGTAVIVNNELAPKPQEKPNPVDS